MAKDNYQIPKDIPNFLDRSIYGYNEGLIDRVIIELKQSPAILEYLRVKAVDLATQLVLEIDHETSEDIRKNINATYNGKISELKELFRLSFAQKIPTESKE